jgi:Flp pilus assembly protein TadG
MIFRKKDRTVPRKRRLLAGLVKDRSGATAIEFAMLAIPFSLLVFAILESCISFAAEQLLINATDDIAREIRTGQLRPADIPDADALKTKICQRIEILVATGCPGLKVDLREFDSFEDAAAVQIKLTADDKIDTTGFGYEPGGPTSKNMLRVFYAWPIITDFLRRAMSNLDGGKTLLFASTTWQNEPFDE